MFFFMLSDMKGSEGCLMYEFSLLWGKNKVEEVRKMVDMKGEV